MGIADATMQAIAGLRPDVDAIYAEAHGYALSDWRHLQQGLVTASGAGASAIPFLHVAAIAADVLFLINRMSVCSFGIGAIQGRGAGFGNILEEEDFSVVLGLWAGASDVGISSNALTAKAAADIAIKVQSKAGLKLITKTMLKSSGIVLGGAIGGQFGAKVGAKVGAKFAAKLGGKVASGFIPFLGAAVGGGINLWFITTIADAAERFYAFKCDVARRV